MRTRGGGKLPSGRKGSLEWWEKGYPRERGPFSAVQKKNLKRGEREWRGWPRGKGVENLLKGTDISWP